MDLIDLIEKKKHGKAHTKEEIRFIVKSLNGGIVHETQIASWLMAVYFKGLNEAETAYLTEALADSGSRVDFGELSNLGTGLSDEVQNHQDVLQQVEKSSKKLEQLLKAYLEQ